MKAARIDAAAVRLADGRVLIAGGKPHGGEVSNVLWSAELYDPSTGKFTSTGSLKTARDEATAVLMADGRALILGGYGCPPKDLHCSLEDTATRAVGLASAEIYDPSTGAFTTAGSMLTPRLHPSALPLPDGRILILSEDTLVEAYDPASGKSTRVGSLLKDYPQVTAALLPSGKVLVMGDGYTAEAELFDPANGQSTAISMANLPDLKKMSGPTTATLLPNGQVLLSMNGYLLTYDPAANSFTETGSISEPGKWIAPTATLLSSGEVLFAGGALEALDGSGTWANANWAGLFDPSTGFRRVHALVGARVDHCAVLLLDGSVLIAGGEGKVFSGLSSAELFIP